MTTFRAIIKLARPTQWAKNLLVFGGVLFGFKFLNGRTDAVALMGFASFSLLSSSVYIFNDILDAKSDRIHPIKRHRPIASGQIKPVKAGLIATVLTVVALGTSFIIWPEACYLQLIYLAIQILYNWRLKSMMVADVFAIAVGFVIRAIYGADLIQVYVSPWLLFCTAALALMLGFGKRRSEFLTVYQAGAETRGSISEYSQASLDALIIMFAAGAGMSYGVYSIESATAKAHPGLFLSSLFVFYAIARYIAVILRGSEGGEPSEMLYGDPHIFLSVLLWAVFVAAAMLGLKIPFIGQ